MGRGPLPTSCQQQQCNGDGARGVNGPCNDMGHDEKVAEGSEGTEREGGYLPRDFRSALCLRFRRCLPCRRVRNRDTGAGGGEGRAGG